MPTRASRYIAAIKDLESRTQPAAAKAAQLARASGATLELFHAISTPVYVESLRGKRGELATVQRSGIEAATKRLERIAARLRRAGTEVTTHAAWDFPPYEAIIRRADEIRADLIVAESHEHHGARWILSYTDWELLRLAPTPVLLVKSGKAWRKPRVLVPVDPTHAHDKPAKLDSDLLGAGKTIADALGGELHAMHSHFEPGDAYPAFGTGAIVDFRRDDDSYARAVQAQFRRLAVANGVKPAARHFVLDVPAVAIPAVARSTRANIVVMGVVSRSRVKRLLIGSTAERVIDRLACDVLIVKPRRFESPVQAEARGVQLMTMPSFPGA